MGLNRSRYAVFLLLIFGFPIIITTLVLEFTKIQIPPAEKIEINPIYQTNPHGEYYRFDKINPNDLKQVDERKNKENFL